MGATCCENNKSQAGNLNIQPPTKKRIYKAQLPLSTSGLYISQNIEGVLNKSGRALNCTFIPGDREYGDNSLILAIGQKSNPKLFVRFYLIYSFYIARYNSKQTDFQSIFYRLASKTHTSQDQIKKMQQFKEAYKKQSNQLKKDIVVINSFFSAKFIIENLNQILLSSNDPKDIGHLIFPMARIFNGIKKTYQTNRNKKARTLYVIAELSSEEKKLIMEMNGKEACFSFSVFMKGFSVESYARKQFNKIKKQNEGKTDKTTFLFTVNFPYKTDKMESKYDYGYYVSPDDSTKPEGDVIFNIMNSFKVVQSFSQSEYDLEYGYLPYVYFAKYTDRIPNIDISSIRVFDICQAVSGHYLKSQSCLFRIIREGPNSLKISQSVISLSQTRDNQKEKLNEVQVQNMINNYIDQSNYKEALELAETYQSSSIIIRAKKLQVLYKTKKYEEAKKYLQTIGWAGVSKDKKITEAQEIIEFITAKLMIEEGKKEKAKEKLKALLVKMMVKYESKFEVIGAQVVLTLEELYGVSTESPISAEIAKSQRQTNETIQKSSINLRGISTTI